MSGRGVGEIMRIRYLGQLFAILFLAIAGAAAQNPAQPRAEIPLQIPNPHYATIEESIVVDAPVDKVWPRVGKLCDITEWMNSPGWADCKSLQGDGGPGTVRSIVNEVLVGQTQYSYTYAQAPRKDTPYNLAHGTISAEALTPTTTLLTYTMLRDDSMLSDDGTRTRGLESRKALVAGPIEKTWARVGKYCDIGEWGFRSCNLISGKEGEIGAVRTIGHSIIVGQTRYSYTYTQPLRATGLYPMYHGTLEARPLGPGRTTLYYTLVWDSSTQPSADSRQKQVETYRLLFEKMLRNMKKLAGGGTLTPEDRKAPVEF